MKGKHLFQILNQSTNVINYEKRARSLVGRTSPSRGKHAGGRGEDPRFESGRAHHSNLNLTWTHMYLC
jgi:hypothetical protein